MTQGLSQQRVPITDSDFSAHFTKKVAEKVFLLPEKQALLVWETHIESNAFSYFHLSDDSPIVTNDWKTLGCWAEAYRDGDYGLVRDLLERQIAAEFSDKIFFLARQNLVLESDWGTFLEAWDSFMDVNDDHPFLSFEGPTVPILLFLFWDIVSIARTETGP